MNTKILLSIILVIFLTSCKNGKLPGGDARKFPDDPKLRIKKNLEEGRGFRLNDAVGKLRGGGAFDFASSNELWTTVRVGPKWASEACTTSSPAAWHLR